MRHQTALFPRNAIDKHPLRIRHATSNDNILLARLGAQTFNDTFAAENTAEDLASYLREAFSPERQAAELVEPGSLFLIAYLQGSPVGYARLREGPFPDGIEGVAPVEIHRIYVVSNWVRQGVGAGLMAACLDEGRNRGRDIIWLGVWEKNTTAISFYRKWGFDVVGKQRFMLGSDPQTDLLMARRASG